MKPLKRLVENVEPHFAEGGKWRKYWPLFDGFATFLFTPGHPTHKGAHIRDGIDLKRTMSMVILAMVPALLLGMYNVGYQHFLAIGEQAAFLDIFLYGMWKVLPLVIVSYGVGLGVEFVFCIIKGHQINEGFLVSGMLIPLVCPPDLPLWMLTVAVIFAVVIGKEVFGGTGMNILNVALTARAFLFFAYPADLSGDKVWISGVGDQVVNGYTGETALAQFAKTGGEVAGMGGQSFASQADFLWAGFIGLIPGSVGETSTLAILIGAAILIFTGIGSWRIMASVALGGLAMGYLLNGFSGSFPDNGYLAIPPYYHLIFGGFAFGAVFMATDPVTASQTPSGKYIYGFLIGVLAVIIRVLNPAYPEGMMLAILFMATDPVTASQTPSGKYIYGFLIGVLAVIIRVLNPAYPEGMMLAILFMNVMAPLIDHYVVQGNINRRLKRVKLATHG